MAGLDVGRRTPPPGFDPLNVQSVASRYTDHAVLAQLFCKFRT